MAGQLLNDFLRRFQPLAPSGAGEWTDSQLMERFVTQRDEAAFASLVRRHGALVLGVGRRILQHQQDAEDVFQATFLILARQAASGSWQSSKAGWLHCIAYRLAIRLGAQTVRRREVERATARLPSGGTEDYSALHLALDEELQVLPEKFRGPLVLCYLEGNTRDQAAKQLGLSLRTLERRLNQGLNILRSKMNKRGVKLPLTLLAAGLSQQATSAAASATVVTATIEAAVLSGLETVVGGAISPRAVALAEGGIKAMKMTTLMKVKIAAVMLLGVGAAAALFGNSQPAKPVPPQATGKPSPAQSKTAKPAAELTWPEGATVKGRITDHQGKPAANAEVVLLGAERIIVDGNRKWFMVGRNSDLPRPVSVRTDAKGEFSITRRKGTANRIVVIAEAPLFWSVSRKNLKSADQPIEIKLPTPGRLAIHCALPGKPAKQPVSIELVGDTLESDSLRFQSHFYSVKNPGEAVFKDLPPGQYIVQRIIYTPTNKNTQLMTDADRQLVKVEGDKQAVVRFQRKVGLPLTGQIRGMENVELRYGHVTIRYPGPEERMANGKMSRMMTAFDVLPIKSDGRFTTDPIPPGKYWLEIFAVRASTPEQSAEQSDFNGRLQFTVPERGDMPKVELIVSPNKRPRRPNRDCRLRVTDDVDQPISTFQAMLHTDTVGYVSWKEGSNGMVGFGAFLARGGTTPVDALVRADGYAPALVRFEGKDCEKLRNGEATIKMQKGQKVELRFTLPSDITWPRGALPEAYFENFEERLRIMRQPVNRRGGVPDFNMLNLRPLGSGRFECRLTKDTPAFYVAVHVPGFLQHFETGPFTLASFKSGILKVAVPRPASVDFRFDPGTTKTDALPFQGVTLNIMRRLHGNTYLEVADTRAVSPTHSMKLTDLAPGTYLLTVRTQPKADSKLKAGSEINPGAYFERKRVTLTAGKSERVTLGYTPFDPGAFRGKRNAVVRIRMPNGMPARGRKVSISWFDGHYGSAPVYSGRLPDSGEVRLEGLTDRLHSDYLRPYTVTVDDKQIGQFGFKKEEMNPVFEFRLAPQIGDQVPDDFELTRISTGKRIRLSNLRGKVVCLEFWATWCGPCQPSMAKLNALQTEKAAAWKDKVVILPVSIDADSDRVLPHVRRRGWTDLDHYWTGEKTADEFDAPAARAFGITGVPHAILIGADGRILWRGHPGGREAGQSLESRITSALKK